MSIADEFTENRDFFKSEKLGNSYETEIKKLLEHYGIEFAKGYLTAVRDISPQIRQIYRTLDTGDSYNVNTRAEMRDRSIELENHVEQILVSASALELFQNKDFTKLPQQKPK